MAVDIKQSAAFATDDYLELRIIREALEYRIHCDVLNDLGEVTATKLISDIKKVEEVNGSR
jgi:hypothetical protein